MKNDHIDIRDLEVETIIGILPDERTKKQKIFLDIELYIDLQPAAKSCDISHTVDYASLASELRWMIQSSEFLLLETAAYAVASYILAPPIGSTRTQIEHVKIAIRKPNALGDRGCPVVCIELGVEDISYESAKHSGHETETLFSCKDSLLHRIKMLEGVSPPPSIDTNYTVTDMQLKSSGPHLLRVYRL